MEWDSAAGSFQTAASRSLLDDDLKENYPYKPTNHSKAFPFHYLYELLFEPLIENRDKSKNPVISRKKLGPHAGQSSNSNQRRIEIVVAFISKWRKEVGNDVYPMFRLIMPDKDRERAMYGLKESTIAKLLIKLVKVDPDSEAALSLKNWKSASAKTKHSAGNFAGRCSDMLLEGRALLSEPGDLSIDDVNEMLDRLSIASKEDQQLDIMRHFYHRMDATELTWLIRIILREMKIGATEKTFLDAWHPDAVTLFNVSSNLRRVCWELVDPSIRLNNEESEVDLMSCFQPQLAQFQGRSFGEIVGRLKLEEDDKVFWVEEKLDGERVQLHMEEDSSKQGGKRFGFWSRKATNYTYLYGNGLHDDRSALTRHLENAFDEGVRNIILDGEMVTWDMATDKIVEFGTLKTAALDQQKNPSSMGPRPVFRVFDIVYLNGKSLTKYTLRDRRKALERAVRSVHRRLEIHNYTEAKKASDIEPLLREVISSRSEGLVLKNPGSAYQLNTRSDNWMKVKPEYMTEYGEALDCMVIGGYYGSGHRGGILSSFLCGLRTNNARIRAGGDPQQFFSFCKVGGGFSSADYEEIRNITEGKWKEWDSLNPPRKYVVLAGQNRQFEKPDVWIKPEDSVVVAIKAASINGSPQFALGRTLRFPRFVKLRGDKDWKSALSIDELEEMTHKLELKNDEKQMTLDNDRKSKRAKRGFIKPLSIVGVQEYSAVAPFARGNPTTVFAGLKFCVMTNSLKPGKKTEDKSKAAIEQLVKHHGAIITQSPTADENSICIADRETVSVNGLKKQGKKSIIRPSWLLDCIHQAEIDVQLGRSILLLPYEPRHVFSAKEGDEDLAGHGVDFVTGGLGIAADRYGDSFAKDVDSIEDLRAILKEMPAKFENNQLDADELEAELGELEHDRSHGLAGIFSGFRILFHRGVDKAEPGSNLLLWPENEFQIGLSAHKVKFAGGTIAEDPEDMAITTVVLMENDADAARLVRDMMSHRKRLPRIVTMDWIEQSWDEWTVLDEDKFLPTG